MHALKSFLQPLVGDHTWVLLRRARRLYNKTGHISPPVSVAPHPLALYRRVIEEAKKNGSVNFLTLAQDLDGGSSADRLNIVLRHDLDFDPEPFFPMAEIEVACGVRSSVYVRVDDEKYSVSSLAGRLRRLADEGFEIGLHTAAYTAATPGDRFLDETKRFADVLGFAPATLTTHGVHPFTLKVAVRLERFLREISAAGVTEIRSDEFPGCRFDRYVHDSNFSRDRSYTFIEQDFFTLASLPTGLRVQVLTHPEYWRE